MNMENKQVTFFDLGYEHYMRMEYEEATRYFTKASVEHLSHYAQGWLGSCYESGLGVEKNLIIAKDLYKVARLWIRSDQSKMKQWLDERLKVLSNVREVRECRKMVDGVGPVKVLKYKEATKPQIRFNKNETVVTINYQMPFTDGFYIAEQRLANWTCDGENRFYDGYTLETDYLNLKVLKSTGETYRSTMEGKNCVLYFPRNLNLDHAYAQEQILGQVHDLLFERAKVVIPQRLKEITTQLGHQEKECKIVKKGKRIFGRNYILNNTIEINAMCIQLPTDSLDSLLIHEIAHDFVPNHSPDFYRKMKELWGEEVCQLDRKLFKEGKWLYIRN